MQKYRKLNVADYELNAVQNNTAAILNLLTTNTLADALLVEDQDLILGDTDIDHQLGRKLVGWIVVRRSAAVDIFDKQGTNTLQDRTLILNSSGAATVSLIVF